LVDKFDIQERSRIMALIRSRDTSPEKLVRRLIHKMGYRFRLYRKDLPGTPDIVLPRLKKVICVHGCFWHGHARCPRAPRPTTNVSFWERKITLNIARDQKVKRSLKVLGWKVLTIWQCQTRNVSVLRGRLKRFLDGA